MSREIPPTRHSHDAREVVSALQKAIRRSSPDDALYWAMEMVKSGYGPWCWARLKVICSEDVGPAEPNLPAQIRALYEAWQDERQAQKGDGAMYVAHAVLLLATARKSRVACWGTLVHANSKAPRREVPDEALDQHTLRGRRMGRGIEHFVEDAARLEPWTGSLDALEAEYREEFVRRLPNVGDEPGELVQNSDAPLVAQSELAQNSHMSGSGQLREQLRLDADQEDR